ncbi:MAG: DUF1788 domain-containing protein [Sphaerochaetaceae bacterium]|nr:DUF1788 domain-containing protein [Sphaerochaetaceae bacterium]
MIPHNLENKSLHDRFTHLFKTISSPRFLSMQGIGNELPFFICPFSPEEKLEMDSAVDNLDAKLQQNGVIVERINLYDLSIALLKDRPRVWPLLVEKEPEILKEDLFDQLQKMLDSEDHLAPAIMRQLEGKQYDVVFIEGVGEVFPYVRTHSLLENLEQHLSRKPLVLFFPGTYVQTLHTGASLELFGRLHDDKYYRAFNIYRYEP